MPGPKTNERPGTRAQLRYARVSAYKARQVLDQIRGESYGRATQILQLSEKDVAELIRKTLDSAVANAENNDGLVAEELYVSACYADEGPTLKRWRPRARGRATRIRKRTCHITVIVSRYSSEELDRQRARAAAKGATTSGHAAEARRRRVAQSRRLEAERREADHDHEHDHDHDHEHDHGAAEAETAETLVVDGPYGPGSAAPLEDGSAPEGFEIKGNEDSMLYHVPGSRYYGQTVAEVWFATVEDAERAGFAAPGGAAEAEGEDD
jgi:large subunit ribosomal protein L22